jgi:hypothetical protein
MHTIVDKRRKEGRKKERKEGNDEVLPRVFVRSTVVRRVLAEDGERRLLAVPFLPRVHKSQGCWRPKAERDELRLLLRI